MTPCPKPPPRPVTLHIVPVSFREACEFIALWHRHHQPPVGMKFALGIATDSELVGVATVGRPVARMFDDGLTLEVNRTAVADAIHNGNSMLYGACWRATKSLGYRRLITYTEAGESGSSLRAAGWQVIAERAPHPGWNRPNRRRMPSGREHIARTLWEVS